MVPFTMKQLHYPYPPLDKAASEQRAGSKGAWLSHFRTVQIQNRLRFVRNVHQLGDGGLHFECHLVLGNAGLNLRIATALEPELI